MATLPDTWHYRTSTGYPVRHLTLQDQYWLPCQTLDITGPVLATLSDIWHYPVLATLSDTWHYRTSTGYPVRQLTLQDQNWLPCQTSDITQYWLPCQTPDITGPVLTTLPDSWHYRTSTGYPARHLTLQDQFWLPCQTPDITGPVL